MGDMLAYKKDAQSLKSECNHLVFKLSGNEQIAWQKKRAQSLRLNRNQG